jgi:hypothetical protein
MVATSRKKSAVWFAMIGITSEYTKKDTMHSRVRKNMDDV